MRDDKLNVVKQKNQQVLQEENVVLKDSLDKKELERLLSTKDTLIANQVTQFSSFDFLFVRKFQVQTEKEQSITKEEVMGSLLHYNMLIKNLPDLSSSVKDQVVLVASDKS